MAAKTEEAPGTDLTTLEVGAVAAPGNMTQSVKIGDVVFNAKRAVNIPTLKHETGQTVAIRIDQPITEKTNTVEKTVTLDGEKRIVTEDVKINVARVTEVQTMSQFEYVLNAISASNIKEAYPNDSYVGKWFAIRKGGVVAGKRYKEVQIVEIEPEGEEA